MSSWEKARTRYNWRVLHPLTMERDSTIMMVNQFTAGDKVSKKLAAYYCLPLWTLRRALCLNTQLGFMSLFSLNAHTYETNILLFALVFLGLATSDFCWRGRWIPWWPPFETSLRLEPSCPDDSIGCQLFLLLRTLYALACLASSLGLICAWCHDNYHIYYLIAVLM